MSRRPRNRLELRAEAEAAERLGLLGPDPRDRRSRSEPKAQEPSERSTPGQGVRMKIVWAVCDIGGRTVASFEYRDKTAAEEFAEQLRLKGKGKHFVRSIKQPITPPEDY